MLIEELATDMRPTGSLGGLARFEDGIEPGVAVGMQQTSEGLEVSLRVFALAVRRVEEHRGGRLG
jgi:hypothetical protein